MKTALPILPFLLAIIFLITNITYAAEDTPVDGINLPTALEIEETTSTCDISAGAAKGGFKKKGFINNTEVKLLNSILAKNLPRDIDFRKMDIDIWPHYVGVEIKDLTLSENNTFCDMKEFYKPWGFRTESISLKMNPYALLIGRIQVKELIVDRPIIQLAQKANGEVNIMDVMNGQRGPLLGWVRLKKLFVHNGQLRFYDEMAGSYPADLLIDMLEVEISDFSVKKQFGLEVQARSPGAKVSNINITGKAGPLTKEFDIKNMDLSLDVTIDDTPLEALLAYIPPELPASPKSAAVDVVVRLKGNLSKGINIKGSLDLKDLILASADGAKETEGLDVTIDLGNHVDVRLLDDYISFEDIMISLQKTKLYLTGRIHDLRRKMKWDVRIRSTDIIIQDMIEFNPLPIQILPSDLDIAGTVKAKINSKGSFDMINADGTIDMAGVSFDYENVFRKNTGSLLDLDFDIKIDPIKTRFDLTGGFRLDGAEMFSVNIFSQAIESLARKTGKTGLNKVAKGMSGLPVTFDKLTGKIEFSGSTLPDAITGVNSDMSMSLSDLAMENIHNSVSSGHDAKISGNIDLGSGTLNLRLTLIYSKEASTQITRYIGTKMYKIEEGRVHLPISVTGEIKNPRVKALNKK